MDTAHARLDGKVGVVPGGTQGLGEAIARLLAERGAAEAARAGAFLASEESGMMTGVNVDYDQTTAGCWEQAPHPTPPA